LRELILEDPDEFVGPDLEEESTLAGNKQAILSASKPWWRRRNEALKEDSCCQQDTSWIDQQEHHYDTTPRVANFEFSSLKESKEVANGESELA